MELLQFLIAAVGLCFAGWGLWMATEDAISLADTPQGDLRRLIALGNMRSQLARAAAQGSLLLVGFVSLLLPPPPSVQEVAAELEQAALVRVGLMIVTAILAIDSVLERRQRVLFLEYPQGRAHKKSHKTTQEVAVLIDGRQVARGMMPEDVSSHPESGK